MFSGVRVVDRPLTEDQMMGEVLSLLLGNSRVSNSNLDVHYVKFVQKIVVTTENVRSKGWENNHDSFMFICNFFYY